MSEKAIDRLVLKTDTLTAEVLPALGGKISSLRRNGVELLQAPLRPYAPRSAMMGFEESDASGFDECLPSVSGCEIVEPRGTVQIPDHGEFWRLPCAVEQCEPARARLTATGTVLPLRLERTLCLDGETLRIDYRMENVGEWEAPYVWSAHPLFCVDPGDAVVLPPSVSQVSVEGSAHGRLGAQGSVHPWPVANGHGADKIDLSLSGRVSDGTGDKLYTAAPAEGWAALERRRAGLRVRVGFDPRLSPCLGLWLCYGGWPEGGAARQHCVAIEPCTAPGDSLASSLENGWARRLAPGQSSSWWMTITVSCLNEERE